MFFGKKEKNNTSIELNEIKRKLSEAILIAKGYRTTKKFAEEMKVYDVNKIDDLIKGKYKELPDRNLLRKIANNSQGRINFIHFYEICDYKTSDPEEDRSWKNWIPEKGSIVSADLGFCEDSIQGGKRPVLILGNNLGLKYSDILFGIPISTKKKGNEKMHVPVGIEYGLEKFSYILCEQTRVMSKRRFFYDGTIWKIGTLDGQKMQEVYNILEFQLGIKDLNFDTRRAYEMITNIRILKKNIKAKESKDLIKLFNKKINEFKEYCKNYNINYEDVVNEYKRFNNYAVQAI